MTVIQKIEEIELKELKLWTENPRDPVNSNSSNQEIINKALFENDIDWELKKLSKSMGPYFDYSELPTVVYNKNVPIVFDGNRRIALGILKHGLIELSQDIDFDIPKPIFSISGAATLPQPIAEVDFEITKPEFSVSGTVSGLVITPSFDSVLVVDYKSNIIII